MQGHRLALAVVGGLTVLTCTAGPALAVGTAGTPVHSDYSGAKTQATTVVLGTKITRPATVTIPKVGTKPVEPVGALAYTGSDAIVGGLAIGTGLVLVGGVLVIGTRRRNTAA